MLKKKTERLIPQSDQPKKQISRGKVTVPKNSKQNALSNEKTVLRTAKQQKPNFRQEKFRRSEKQIRKNKNQNSKHSKNPFRKTVLQGL